MCINRRVTIVKKNVNITTIKELYPSRAKNDNNSYKASAPNDSLTGSIFKVS